ncbi:hypothetical protein DFH08DRAFT_818641 [Mycena albidolilacea]|uniref:Uncharacterized protein n=1 Tax=Mycena albidolilacea TaxID=1033008 RepID=A0AAD6ZH28_9AGAR|nr:hypothetical protein DFH08DRAFT_818641 [Mycena albidolilacea]
MSELRQVFLVSSIRLCRCLVPASDSTRIFGPQNNKGTGLWAAAHYPYDGSTSARRGFDSPETHPRLPRTIDTASRSSTANAQQGFDSLTSRDLVLDFAPVFNRKTTKERGFNPSPSLTGRRTGRAGKNPPVWALEPAPGRDGNSLPETSISTRHKHLDGIAETCRYLICDQIPINRLQTLVWFYISVFETFYDTLDVLHLSKTAVTDGTGGTRPSRGPQLPSDGTGIPVPSRKTAVFVTAVPFNGRVEALTSARGLQIRSGCLTPPRPGLGGQQEVGREGRTERRQAQRGEDEGKEERENFIASLEVIYVVHTIWNWFRVPLTVLNLCSTVTYRDFHALFSAPSDSDYLRHTAFLQYSCFHWRRERRSARAEAKPFNFQYMGSVFRSDSDIPSVSRPFHLAYTHFVPQAYLVPPLDPGREPHSTEHSNPRSSGDENLGIYNDSDTSSYDIGSESYMPIYSVNSVSDNHTSGPTAGVSGYKRPALPMSPFGSFPKHVHFDNSYIQTPVPVAPAFQPQPEAPGDTKIKQNVILTKGYWTVDELSAFYEFCLGQDADAVFKTITLSSNKCWALVGITRDAKQMKNRWDTSLAIYKKLVPLLKITGGGADDDKHPGTRPRLPDSSSSVLAADMMLTAWQWLNRYNENPKADHEVPCLSAEGLSDIEDELQANDGDNMDASDNNIIVVENPKVSSTPVSSNIKIVKKGATDPRDIKPSTWSRLKPASHTHIQPSHLEGCTQVDKEVMKIAREDTNFKRLKSAEGTAKEIVGDDTRKYSDEARAKANLVLEKLMDVALGL